MSENELDELIDDTARRLREYGANRLTPPFQLRPGQQVRIPQPRYHVVEKGDTVYGLARRFEIDQSTLVRMNGLGPPYIIKVGQSLFLPAFWTSDNAERTSESLSNRFCDRMAARVTRYLKHELHITEIICHI